MLARPEERLVHVIARSLVLAPLAAGLIGCASGEFDNRMSRVIGWFDQNGTSVDTPDVRDVWRSRFAAEAADAGATPLAPRGSAPEQSAWRMEPATASEVEQKLSALETVLVRYAEATGQSHPGETGMRLHVLEAMDQVSGIDDIDGDPYYNALSQPLSWYYIDELTIVAEQLEDERMRKRSGADDAAIEWTALVAWFRDAFEAELRAEQERVAQLRARSSS